MDSDDLNTIDSQEGLSPANWVCNSDCIELVDCNEFDYPRVSPIKLSEYQLNEESSMEQVGTTQSACGDTTTNPVQSDVGSDDHVAANTTMDDDDSDYDWSDDYDESDDRPVVVVAVTVSPQGERSHDHQANNNETIGEDEEVNSGAVAQGDNESSLLLPIREEDENPVSSPRSGKTVYASRKRTRRMKPRTHFPDKVKKELLSACREYQDTFSKTTIKSIAHILYLKYHETPEFRHLSEKSILRLLYKMRSERKRVYMKGLY